MSGPHRREPWRRGGAVAWHCGGVATRAPHSPVRLAAAAAARGHVHDDQYCCMNPESWSRGVASLEFHLVTLMRWSHEPR